MTMPPGMQPVYQGPSNLTQAASTITGGGVGGALSLIVVSTLDFYHPDHPITAELAMAIQIVVTAALSGLALVGAHFFGSK